MARMRAGAADQTLEECDVAVAALVVETSKYNTTKSEDGGRKKGRGFKFSLALSSSSPLQTQKERGRQKRNFLEGINFVSARHSG